MMQMPLSLNHLLDRAGTLFASNEIVSRLPDKSLRRHSYGAFYQRTRQLAQALQNMGLQKGERVATLCWNHHAHLECYFGIPAAGGVMHTLNLRLSPEEIAWIANDAQDKVLIIDDVLLPLYQQFAHLYKFERVIVFPFSGAAVPAPFTDYEQLLAGTDTQGFQYAPHAEDDAVSMCYTSGTTGRPKGCMLTHGNFMFEVDNIVAGMPQLFTVQGASTLLFLPLAHVFGRIIQLGCIHSGTRLGHAPDVKNLLGDLQSFQPTFLLAVPRVFEKVFNSAQQKATAEGKGNIFNTAAQTAIDYSKSLDTGGPGLGLKIKHKLFDRLVYGKLRAAMGGKIEWAVSGGAPLGDRLGHFFRGIGVTILEGYGLTETSAATTVNRPDALKIGTVGQPFPGASVKVAADGELMLAGAQIFKGYWNNPTATAEAIEPDGWFHSGDIGEIDDQGFVKITGRKKELIVTAGGKNVAPAVLEDRLRANWLVSQCMVVGDAQPFIAALVTIDPESFPGWLKQAGKPEGSTIASMTNDPDLVAEIQKAVDEANKAVSNAEAIKKFTILQEDWTEEGGQLTPSMKLKRNVVMKEYASEVDALYA